MPVETFMEEIQLTVLENSFDCRENSFLVKLFCDINQVSDTENKNQILSEEKIDTITDK